MSTPTEDNDLTQLDDTTLIARRAELRNRLEHVSPHGKQRVTLVELCNELTDELARRERAAW